MASVSHDPIEELGRKIRSAAAWMVGGQLISNLGVKAVEKFLEDDSLPVKIRYTDWWPKTCQKVRKIVSSFWSRRLEGTTAMGVSSGALVGAYLLSDTHPALNKIWSAAQKATFYCLNLLGISKSFTEGLEVFLPLSFAPSIAGAATTLSLGAYDVLSKSWDPDQVLETKPLFNPTLQAELDEILDTARTLKEEGGFLQNLLLYGPPGTGKTMISKWIAENSGMNYMLLSGGDLLKTMGKKDGPNQTGAGGAVALLQKLIEHAKSLTSPTVIFIDEAEACFGKRDSAKSQELVSLLNAFLELTGNSSAKMMIILATNRPEDLDSAALSRMDYKIRVGLPQPAERKNMIEMNIPILIKTEEMQKLFTPAIIAHIAKQTKGLSGRDLFKLINRLKVELLQKRDLTPASIDRVLARFVKQEQQVEENFSGSSLKDNPFYNKNRKELLSAG